MGAIKNTADYKDLGVTSNENRDDSVIRLGDFMEIVNYGSMYWISKIQVDPSVIEAMKSKFPVIAEDDAFLHLDMAPELVGKRGIITRCSVTNGKESYALEILAEGNFKKAWYYKSQLKKVSGL